MTADDLVRTWPEWACPEDASPLERKTEEQAEILVCAAGHRFRIAEGIPRFVGDATYSAAFGVQWKRYRLTQLDSTTGTTISRDRARRCLGEELWEALPGLDVLEVGCGAGRFTEVLLGRGARVTSVDLSEAVEANAETFPPGASHRVAQADVLRLPFAARAYDVVFCLGVVQHTPIPEQTIAALYEQVRPGGWLVFDHYSRRLSWYLGTAPLFRAYLRRLPPEAGLQATETLVRLLLPLHRRSGRRLGRVLSRVSPVYSYFGTLPELDDAAQREWALLDTHDALTDWFKHFRSAPQIEQTLRELGAEAIDVSEGGNGAEARARRPVGPDGG